MLRKDGYSGALEAEAGGLLGAGVQGLLGQHSETSVQKSQV